MPRPAIDEAPCLFPTLLCRDADAMIRWLRDVVGFRERVAYRDAAGVVQHAELALGASLLMLGQWRDSDYARLVGEATARRTDALYVAVTALDSLHAAVVAAGAPIETPLRDTPYGSREFACRDPEGNLWSFGTYWPKAGEPPLPG